MANYNDPKPSCNASENLEFELISGQQTRQNGDNKQDKKWTTNGTQKTPKCTQSVPISVQQTGPSLAYFDSITHAVKSAVEGLHDLQRRCLAYIYLTCVESGSKCSTKIVASDLAETLNTTTGGVRKTFKALREKNLLHRVESKNGRGGYSIFEIPDDVWEALCQKSKRAELFGIESVQQSGQNGPRKVGIINTKNYLPTVKHELFNPENLELLDRVGIGQKHLDDLERNLQAEGLFIPWYAFEEYVERFAVYAQNPAKSKITSVPGLFIALALRLARGETVLTHIPSSLDEDFANVRAYVAATAAKVKQLEELKAEAETLTFERFWLEAPEELKNSLAPRQPNINEDARKILARLKWREMYPEDWKCWLQEEANECTQNHESK